MSEQSRDMNIILPAIEVAKREQYRKNVVAVSEEVFRRRLLPLAVSRYTSIDFEEDIELTHWQQTTGNAPYYGVKVMRGGEVYLETPPLILSPEITFEGESILERVNAVQKAERTGNTAGDVMDSKLMQPIFKTRGLSDAVHAWLLIFRLYGIHVVPKDDETDSSENAPEVAEQEDVSSEAEIKSETPAHKPTQWEESDDDDFL